MQSVNGLNGKNTSLVLVLLLSIVSLSIIALILFSGGSNNNNKEKSTPNPPPPNPTPTPDPYPTPTPTPSSSSSSSSSSHPPGETFSMIPDRSAPFVPRPFIFRDHKARYEKIKNHTLNLPGGWWPYPFFESLYECTHGEDRVGDPGDGGKWICGMSTLLQVPKCIVYSMGSNGVHDFEDIILQYTQCEIHTFDMDDFSGVFSGTRVHFHKAKIGDGSDGSTTITDIMKSLNHTYIDVLKIDVEGAEYATFEHLAKQYTIPWIGQLLVEVHLFGVGDFPSLSTSARYEIIDKMVRLYTNIEKLGLVQFHREENPNGHDACEYAFGNLIPRPPV